LPPGGKLGRVEVADDLVSRQRETLPQVDLGPELVHRRLTPADVVRRRGVEQPPRQQLLAAAEPRARDQLKERAVAEEIEVRRVGMFVGKMGQPFRSGPVPAPFDAGQAAPVEIGGAPRGFPLPKNAGMGRRERGENGGWQQQPEGRNPGRPQDGPAHNGNRDDRHEPGVGKAVVLGIEPGCQRLAFRQTR
jgi:hypothetical protein